jgi:hypothetical protein
MPSFTRSISETGPSDYAFRLRLEDSSIAKCAWSSPPVRFRFRPFVFALSVLFLCVGARVSVAQVPREGEAVTITGTASNVGLEASHPKEFLRKIKLRFFIVTSLGGDRNKEESVEVEMIERTIEGTVRNGSVVRVEGKWTDQNRLRAQRITDLDTQATIGYESAALRFPDGKQLSLLGTAQFVEEKIEGHKGEWKQTQKIRFVVKVPEPVGPWQRGDLVSVEMVKLRIKGSAPRQGYQVLVVGRWTKRNVLRADTITDVKSGGVTQ